MEPEARYTVVGSIVLLLIVAAAMGAIWLSRAGVDSQFRFYTIHFEHQSLEGLQVGGDVNMQGIKVGRVDTYSIERGNINRVNVRIRVERRTPVSTNTTAVVARNLVTGIARINLETPGTPGPELVPGPDGEPPVIAEGTSGLDQIARSANNLVITAESSLKKVDELLDDDNRKAFAQMLTGVRDLALGLNRRLDTVDRTAAALTTTAQALTGAAQSFGKTSETIASVTGQLGAQAGPLGRELEATLKDTRTTLEALRGATGDLSKATRSLERDIGAMVRRTDDAADIGLLELRATAQQLRAGTELIGRTLDRLQDPRASLLGPGKRQLGPGEQAP
ncbi:MAG TPA: MlaD family protein [Burkholderiaceae bacterium]|nr:MlaD family protein [Burkholderiaceae bacterium]